jgi:hypothetical protein
MKLIMIRTMVMLLMMGTVIMTMIVMMLTVHVNGDDIYGVEVLVVDVVILLVVAVAGTLQVGMTSFILEECRTSKRIDFRTFMASLGPTLRPICPSITSFIAMPISRLNCFI